ncbi:MAG: hypothetical protein HFI08_04835, partial [Bacilli bacterium]|nr:hypothetical protein [Bacilli bacterium]
MNQGNLKLEKFQNKGKKKQRQVFLTLGIVVVLLVAAVLIYRSYAVYQEQQEYDAIEGKVPGYNDNYDVKVALTIDGTATTTFPAKGTKAVDSIVCDKGATGVWDYTNWTLLVRNLTSTRTRCQVNFVTRYMEGILNGADPVLQDDLVPVTIDNNGTVKKAKLGTDWYSYTNKRWANAVILNNKDAKYGEGETIPESNIESYFVWIPRYKYKIFNDGNYPTQTGTLTNNALPSKAQTIEVVFETNTNAKSTGTGVGQWLTHPAFTAFDTNGMWVGKFETGYKGSTDTASSQKNVNEPGSVQIKPNVNSWRSIQVSNAYLTSYDYRRDYNSHMMKNTEWGAVAFLQHSKYGSQASVRINNNSSYVTGYAATKEPTCGYTATNEECNKYGTDASVTQPYNTSTGYLASTTGNITGVYDMSGGAWEYVMGIMVDKNGKPMSGRNSKYNSGFNGTFGCPTCDSDNSGLTELTTGIAFPSDTRYYDQYAYAENDETYNRRILGDATGEMGPFATATYGSQNRQIGSWYADEAW